MFQCRAMRRYSFQADYPTRSQQSLRQPDRGTCPESVGAMQCRPRRSVKSSKQGCTGQLDRHCSGQEKCLAGASGLPVVASGRLARQRRGPIGGAVVRTVERGGQQQHSSDESSSTAAQQSGGGPLGSWLSPGSSLALGPLGVVVAAGSADGTGRREESRLGWDG